MENIENLNIVWMSLTYNCNNKCEYCYTASNFEENKKKTIPLEKALNVIDFLSDLNTKKIILIGGEPTLYKGLDKILERIGEKGIKKGIVSNGRKFKDKYFARKIKQAKADYITISLLDSNAKSHDMVSGVKGSFYETLQGIKTAGHEGINVATNTVITSNNKDRLEEIVDLLQGEAIKEMTFNICGVCLSKDSNNNHILHPKESVKAFEKVYSYAKSRKIRARLVTPMPLCYFDESLLKEFKEKKLVSGGPCQLSYGRNF